MSLSKLVKEALTSFVRLLGNDGALVRHGTFKYHKDAVLSGKDFLKSQENPQLRIIDRIDTERIRKIKGNRRLLVPIDESIMFLGRQNIPFRGHRDDDPLNFKSSENEGNFRELLKYCIQSGDRVLSDHCHCTASSRATYISKTTQNYIIECCAEGILSVIINRVYEAGFYSIGFDETTDISHISQMAIVFRYIRRKIIREDFIKFVELSETISNMSKSDSELDQAVLVTINELKLNKNLCIGISTDGCSVMVSDLQGAVKTVKEECYRFPSPMRKHRNKFIV